MVRILDDNQNFDLTRHALISYFAKDMAFKCGYEIEHFEPCMKFIKNLYYEHCKNREDAQKL